MHCYTSDESRRQECKRMTKDVNKNIKNKSVASDWMLHSFSWGRVASREKVSHLP